MSDADAEKAIPAIVRMFSGCEDKQTSADVSNVASFQLPDPAGRAGGALTSSLLNVTYADHEDTGKDLSFLQVLLAVRDKLNGKGFSQIPQLSSSRNTNLDDPFTIVPETHTSGTRRAVMIGINYVGHNPGELRGCHNDVFNMLEYLKKCHGFEDDNVTLLLDDGKHTSPTASNIMYAFGKIAAESKPGDVVFIHYSGHGCSIKDDNGDEADGMDEALCPLDYKKSGVLRDDLVFEKLITPLRKGVVCTCIMDCCHSGSILDLPYYFVPNGEQATMKLDEDFQFGPIMELAQAFASLGLEGLKELHEKGKRRRQRRRNRWKKRLGI